MVSLKVFCICLILQLASAVSTDTYYHFQQVGTDIQTGLILLHTTEEGQTTGPMEIYVYGYPNVDVDVQNQTLDTLKGMIEGGQLLQVSRNNDKDAKFPLNTVQYETIFLTKAVEQGDRAVLTLTNAKCVIVEQKQ